MIGGFVTDLELRAEAILVRDTLIEKGLETPMIDTGLSASQKYERIKALMGEVVSTLGLDLSDDSLAETPHRIAQMYVHEVFSGLDYSRFPKLSIIENKMGASAIHGDIGAIGVYDAVNKCPVGIRCFCLFQHRQNLRMIIRGEHAIIQSF